MPVGALGALSFLEPVEHAARLPFLCAAVLRRSGLPLCALRVGGGATGRSGRFLVLDGGSSGAADPDVEGRVLDETLRNQDRRLKARLLDSVRPG